MGQGYLNDQFTYYYLKLSKKELDGEKLDEAKKAKFLKELKRKREQKKRELKQKRKKEMREQELERLGVTINIIFFDNIIN